ncbi:hypothetical protein GCM10011428_84230 [Streptomyces violaceus]|uniref:transposase n=1 Tax=Streptomyces violaceus TaxID=1936 RepID=UPI0033780769
MGPGHGGHVADHGGDNPERLDSEASFAALCGVSPVERSSGRRQFPVASTAAATGRPTPRFTASCSPHLRVDPRTQDYYERRIKEGKTRREIVRCLKRYAAREVFPPGKTATASPPLIGAVVSAVRRPRCRPAASTSW